MPDEITVTALDYANLRQRVHVAFGDPHLLAHCDDDRSAVAALVGVEWSNERLRSLTTAVDEAIVIMEGYGTAMLNNLQRRPIEIQEAVAILRKALSSVTN